ncbi:MAG: N-acetylglucosamine-6-phosphate deacetylase [Enterococcaceae bacterium]|jgi:N-acetylglucosamine-6-phosphate deacetylase|nr:N-acetylglucosamine-6-phosphate deacetylase [Enterococcaceae bacterium]
MKTYRCSKIYTGKTTFEEGVLVVSNGKIQSVAYYDQNTDYENLDERYREYCILPGLIDSHDHGGYGIDFMTAELDDIEKLMHILPQEGITAVIPTIGAMPARQIADFILRINRYMSEKKSGICDVLGTNIEGPFLNIDKAGLQPEGAIIDPDIDALKKWLQLSNGNMKIMTIAPELPGAIEVIRCLIENKVVVSAGHSNATMKEMNAAIEAGCNQVTHLFNGMRSMHHRELGISGVGLCNDGIYAEMAGFDTYSIHPEIWKMIFRVKGVNRMILTTDASALKGLPDGHYQMMDREVDVKDGRLFTPYDGGNMHPGVPMTMIGCVQNMLKYTGATLADIAIVASLNPAIQCRIDDRKGSLETGKDADFIVVDDHNTLLATYCCGEKAFEKKEMIQ